VKETNHERVVDLADNFEGRGHGGPAVSHRLGYLLNRSRSAINTTESAGQVGIQPSEADSDGKALTCAAPVT
jgi:hypothetical protein